LVKKDNIHLNGMIDVVNEEDAVCKRWLAAINKVNNKFLKTNKNVETKNTRKRITCYRL